MSNFNNNGLGDGGLQKSKDKFATPPKTGIMKMLSDNNITPPKSPIDAMMDDIAKQEAECLKTIHTRYCILKMLPISIADVQRYQPSKKQMPHYYEYWYKFGTKAQYMLMTRDLKQDAEGVNLIILFNKELVREGE